MSNERVEGQTVEEELADVMRDGSKFRPMAESRSIRIVDLIKELIDDRAGEKACEEIGKHEDDYDHDLMYNVQRVR